MGFGRIMVVLTVVSVAAALFEDQAFKFDWRLRLVGVPTRSFFLDDGLALLSTESNVIAALDVASGVILWRHQLSGADGGAVLRDLTVSANSGNERATTLLSRNSSEELVVQTWNARSGFLMGESLVQTGESAPADWAFISSGGDEVNAIYSRGTAGLEVKTFDAGTGSFLRSSRLDLEASSEGLLQCANADTAFVCVSGAGAAASAFHAAVPARSGSSPLTETLLSPIEKPLALRRVPGRDAVSVEGGDGQTVVLTFEDGKLKETTRVLAGGSDTFSVVYGCGDELLRVSQASGTLRVTRVDEKDDGVFEIALTGERGRIVSASSNRARPGRRMLLLQFDDGSVSAFSESRGGLLWTREEGLASLVSAELVDVGDHAVVFEDYGVDDEARSEFSTDALYEGRRDVVSQFAKRVRSHLSQLHCFVRHLLSVKDLRLLLGGGGDQGAGSDDFGIRKMIVVVSKHGKVFGVDSRTGSVMWQLLVPGGVAASSSDQDPFARLFVQRTAHHFGMDPICSLIFKSRDSGMVKVLTFNPLSGETTGVFEPTGLGASYAKVFLIHHASEDQIRPLAILSEDGRRLFVHPEGSEVHLKPLSGKMFVASVDPKGDRVVGKRITVTEDGRFKLTTAWTLSSPGAKILQVVGKSTDEVVHSQGRVMADRSVLFKYINPNLGLVLAEGKDASSKTFINVFLVDLVTGKVVFSATHKRVDGPYHVIHSENWAVYAYHNEKSRRVEVASLELFEGKTQSNSTVFSSFTSSVLPLVERQAFILRPSYVTAIAATRTEKAITTRHILMATSTGAIFDVPRHMLDPRRPNVNTPPEQREPGLPPYIPELDLPSEAVLNYNQSLAQVKGILTAPTGLESTSVVFAHGLDLYCTRVTPSKGFDLLKDDFDHYVISIVLVALIVASFVTKRLSQRKKLNQAWR